MKTRVIAGFPGVGKSYAMKLDDGYNGFFIRDSDSSKFPKDGFPDNYMEHIIQMITVQNPTVLLVSSHKIVREELVKAGIHFTLVYPNMKLRGEYIQRYTNRGSSEAFLKLLFDNWHQWVGECMNQPHCDKIELQAGKYLIDII